MSRNITARRRALIIFFIVMAWSAGGALAEASGTSSISGTVFRDVNRDAVQQSGEAGIASIRLYLYDANGSYLKTTLTDVDGHYSFASIADGGYRVRWEFASWSSLRSDWIPTTTGSLLPDVNVQLSGQATANFGWRPIVRSTTLGSPITSFTGANGMRVESYDDVVTAHQIFDTVMLGLVGVEAPNVLIRFDFGDVSTQSVDNAAIAVGQGSDGKYNSYSAVAYGSWIAWLDGGDAKLSHEYGHAWTLYYAYIVQQDPSLAGYLQARGIEPSDPRLGTSHGWNRVEMIAEDYRQLFGSANARLGSQENGDIPSAGTVPGLADYLRTTFTAPPAGSSGGSGTTAPVTVTNLTVNPANVKSSGTVAFSISTAATVTVRILDASGRLVRTLMSGVAQNTGSVSTSWNRTDASGRRAKSGSYSAVVDVVDSAGRTATASVKFSVA